MYLFTSLTSVLAWKRVYPRKFDALFRPGRRHPVQTQTPSVQSTAENLSCTGSLPEQKPASNLPSPLYPCCTKTTACLRELYSLTVLKSERFLYQKRYSWEVKLSIWWSEKVERQGDFPPAFLPSQAVPGKYFRPHLVNWDDFAPSMTSARITPPPTVATYRLTPELSGFSHIWDKLASISLNGKCCRLSNISRLRKLSLYFLT